MSPFENQIPIVNSEDVILLSSTSSASTSDFKPEVCEVCGDRVNSRRYGASACLGCTVFFRRAIVNKMQYRCLRDQNCFISHTYRCACRYCRFQKCLRVGMQPSAIQRRDIVGPRKTSRDEKSRSPDVIIIDAESENFLQEWASFQKIQFSEHLQYFVDHQVDVAFHKDSSNFVKFRRRARAADVNIMLKLALKQASEWGNRLKLFKKLNIESKKSVLAEYYLAFMLIDQGLKTSKEADLGIWLLQNGSFMHPDYFFGLPVDNIGFAESMKVKIQLHQNFVSELLHCVGNPFRKLEIDEVECAALKTILLLTPSCSKRAIYAGQEGALAGFYQKCMEELMEHSKNKDPERAAERFGEIMLLIGSIRCGVKTIYNQTRVSDLFNFMKFDDTVKEILLT
ncbi:Protein CBR-NHR-260 [Caenorhabditis briggsae]|uniref:Protein CBR-NHR-260 n=1 Tax=Caenorhabditis briggsae TaxID=6238 RepID=A8X2K8_CAEBR|nr:Protein CBR-NHR-260 [Caenorhabditis briggsae]CAP26868.1 Protein CBR-NHR-260 [Caenorhabditis briggsae]